MHQKFKFVSIALVAFMAGSFFVNAAQAWSSNPLPDCDSDYIIGRETGNIDRPSRVSGSVPYLPSNAETAIKSFFGTRSTFLRAVMNVPNAGISNILAFNQTMYRGFGQNAPEVRDRFMAATFSNLLKMECRARVTMYYLGFPVDRSNMASLNDNAAYDKESRNHSLYQRTDDLEQQIRLLRQDIANLARSMNANSFQAATEPVRSGTATLTVPAPIVNTPAKPIADTMSAADAVIFKACTDACTATGKACSINAKTTQECTLAEASCTAGCLDIVKR